MAMRQVEHNIQDAFEPYAVGVMQATAEQLGLAPKGSSSIHFNTHKEHLRSRKVTSDDLETYPEYKQNADRHSKSFVLRLNHDRKPRTLRFDFVERDARNAGRKEDLIVILDGKESIPFSLKNYRNSIARAQVSAGTFNSLACSFLFDAGKGVGMYVDPTSGKRFKGSNRVQRDLILTATGRESAIENLALLDELNDEIKRLFVYSPEFEFLDEDTFDSHRKRVGTRGAEILHDLISSLPEEHIRSVMLARIGFDGSCEQLLFDPDSYSDSLTVPEFKYLIHKVRHDADMKFDIVGQSVRFAFSDSKKDLLVVDIPFTINKNGAWISEEYTGKRFHKKEGVALATGQRRPKKSKELATSVNTYVNFEAAGILLGT